MRKNAVCFADGSVAAVKNDCFIRIIVTWTLDIKTGARIIIIRKRTIDGSVQHDKCAGTVLLKKMLM